MSQTESERERIIRETDVQQEFTPLEDGYVYFCPSPGCGCFSAYAVRAIADELDRRNKAWDEQVAAELSKNVPTAD